MILKNFIWDFLGKIANQGISFIISLILTRYLAPDEYGVIVLAMAAIMIMQPLIHFGLGTALVQQQDVEEEDFSTAFYTNIIMGALLTCCLFFGSSAVANIVGNKEIAPISRWLSFLFIISGFSIIQRVKLTRDMNFKYMSYISTSTSLIGGLSGIIMAINGFGVYALVAQQLVSATLNSILHWVFSSWRPLFFFSFSRLFRFLPFGSKMLGSQLIAQLFDQIDKIFIGRVFSISTLGLYNRATSLNLTISKFSSDSLSRVLFAYISKHQDNLDLVRKQYKKSLQLLSFFSMGISGLIYVSVEDLFTVLFTDRWIQSAYYFKLCAINAYAYPTSVIMIQTLIALGYPGKNLRLDIIKRTIKLSPFIIGFFYGLDWMLYGIIIQTFIGVSLNIYFVKKIISISFVQHWIWLLTPITLAILSALSCSFIPNLENDYLNIFIHSLLFAILYLIGNALLNKEPIDYFRDKLKLVLKKLN